MVKHTAGSIPISQHRLVLERELGRMPTQSELFQRTHRREKGKGDFVDNKSKEHYLAIFGEKYRDQDGNSTPLPAFHPQAWCEATAGPRKGRLYGFGHYEHPSAVLSSAGSTSSSQSSVDLESFRSIEQEL